MIDNKYIDLELAISKPQGLADHQEDIWLELSDIKLDCDSKSEDISESPIKEGKLLLRLPRFKQDMYKKATAIDWKKYIDQDQSLKEKDIERIKSINLYCLNLYKERSGEKNSGETLKYIYSLMFGVSLNLKTSRWWSTSMILAAGALVCHLFKLYIDNLQEQSNYFKKQYDKLDELFGKVSAVDLSITDIKIEEGSSIGSEKGKSQLLSGSLTKLSLKRSESENKKEYEKESLHVAAIIAITFYKLEKELGLRIGSKHSGLQIVEHYINMAHACLEDIIVRKYSDTAPRFDASSVRLVSDEFSKSIKAEYEKKLSSLPNQIFGKSKIVSIRHFTSDIEQSCEVNSSPQIPVNSIRVPTFYTLNPERFIRKNKANENIASKEVINGIFSSISRIVQHETDIQNKLIVINTMSLISCWLLGLGIDQAQLPYPRTNASEHLALVGSTVLFLTSQLFDSISSKVNEKRSVLRQAKIEYNIAVRDAFNKGWVKSGTEIDVVHMVNESVAKTWHLLEMHDLPINKFHSEDIAIISMNMFKGLCRAISENKENSVNDNDFNLIAYNWQAYVRANSCERLNCHKVLCYDVRARTSPIIFFNNMPNADLFFEIADAILKKKKDIELRVATGSGGEAKSFPAFTPQYMENFSMEKVKSVGFIEGKHNDDTKVDDHYNFPESKKEKTGGIPISGYWSRIVANAGSPVERLRARSI